jgi:hypothetical protein
MSNFCHNTNDPDWKILEAALGRADAEVAYELNKKEIPTIEEARLLLSQAKVEEKDEQISRSPDAFKLKRAIAQMNVLTLASEKGNDPQKETMAKIMDMNRSYQEFLQGNLDRIKNGEAPIKTISVSNLLGNSDFKGDAKLYEAFKLFGTFMHEVIELASVEALAKGVSIQKVMTKEFFDSSYENYGKKTPFVIEEFSTTMMYEAAVEIANNIPSNGGHIIVPEITVMGTNANQARIIGRVDLTIIDRMGRVKIFDFKTKKVTDLVTFGPGKPTVDNADKALLNIAQKGYEVSNLAGTMVKLVGNNRTEYEKWTQQLKVYENILMQSGIPVSDNTIVAFIYQTTILNPETPEIGSKYLGSVVHVFDEKNFFDYAKTVAHPDPDGFWNNSDVSNRLLETSHKIINEEIPTGVDNSYDKLVKAFKKLEFDVPGSKNRQLLDNVKNLIAAEKQQISQDISSMKNNPEYKGSLTLLEGRQAALSKLDDILQREDIEDQVMYSLNFSIVMEQVDEEMSRLMELSEIAVAEFRGQAFLKSNDQIKTVTTASAKARAMFDVIQVLRETITEAKENPANGITEDSAVMKKLSLIDSYTESLAANMREIGLATAMGTIKSAISEKGFNKVKGELSEIDEGKLIVLRKKLADLREGKFGGPIAFLKNKSLLFMSPRYKKLLAEKMGVQGGGFIEAIERVEMDIKKLERRALDGFDYDDESIRKYLEGSGDPNQDWSIGSQDFYMPDGILSSTSIDKMIASVSNKDLLISAQTQINKNTLAAATRTMMTDMANLKVDQRLEKLRSIMSIEQLNDMISETQERSFMDYNTGEVSNKNVLHLNRHYGSEYANKFSDFKNDMFVFRNDIKELKMAHNSAVKMLHSTSKTISDAEASKNAKEAMKALTEKIAQRDAATNEHLEFKIKHSSLEYVPRFYEVQIGIPENLRQQIQYKYLEIEAILFNVGPGNEAELEDEDYAEMEQLRDDIRVLRNDAKKLNPSYGEYIDELNEFFEFGVDTQRFEKAKAKAKIKYADQPALWDKWNKENTVNRPNAAWYQRIGELNEARSAIYEHLEATGFGMPMAEGPNGETLMDLMADYRAIVKPHKKDGRVNPQFLTDAELKELAIIQSTMDYIQQASEEMRAGKKGSRPSEDIRNSLNAINAELKQISKRQISPAYLKEFDDEHNRLMSAYKEKNQALAMRAVAITSGDAAAIDKANDDLAFADGQFAIVEDSFEEWYNKKHVNKYASITDGNDVKSMKMPKAFNFEKLPSEEVYDKYMDMGVPNGKFGVKTIRPEAINHDFLMSPEGIPMPNNIRLDAQGNYEVTPGTENQRMNITKVDGTMVDAQLINPKFMEMTKNKEVHEFYNAFTKSFWTMQSKLQGRKIGYDTPGFAATATENIAREGVLKAMEMNWDKWVDKNLKTYGQQDIVDNMYGDNTSNIRQRFTAQLPESLQTKDSVGAILMYMVEGNYNIAMQQIAPQAEATIEFMKLQHADLSRKIQANATAYAGPDGEVKRVNMDKNLKDLQRSIDIMEFERDKFLYGKTVKIENAADRKMHKIVNGMFAYASFIRIGFDVANQAKNYLSGNVQAFIAAGGVAGDHYTRKDYMWAKGQVYGTGGFLSNYFADWGKINDIHDSTMLYRMFNPAMKDFMKYMSDATDGKGRRVMGKLMHVSELGYVLQDKGDTEIAVTVMYSVLNNYKFAKIAGIDPVTGDKIYELDAEGKQVMVPAHEAYVQDPKNGMLVRSASVEYSQQDEDRLRHIVYSEMRRAQGNYSGQDQTHIESTLGGKLMFFFKKYLVPQFLNRFGYVRPNWEAEEVALGYWRAVGMATRQFGGQQVAKHMLLGSKRMNNSNMNTMGPLLTRKVHQAKRDAMAMFVLSALGMMAITYMKKKKDDDEELSVLEGNAIRVLWGVKGETMSMLPIGSGADEYIRNFTTLTTGVRELTGLWRMANHAGDLGLAMLMGGGVEPDPSLDSAAYQSAYKGAFYSKKTGSYEAGDPKLMKDFYDFTGLKNFRGLLHPEDRLTNVN